MIHSMRINRNNYEIFFIDYYDGKLATVQQRELEVFLESNPDLKLEFESFEHVAFPGSETTYEPKSGLKKQEITPVKGISEESYETFFIAWYENDLSPQERALLLQFLKVNPHLEKEFQLHKELRVQKEQVVFANKEQLKKRSFIVNYWSAAAAVILIVLTAGYLLLQNNVVLPEQQIEISLMDKVTITAVIQSEPSHQMISNKRNDLLVYLPAPASIQTKDIKTLAAADLKGVSIHQQLPSQILEAEFSVETSLVADAEKPKKRGLIAQFFRRNVEELTADLGINNEPNTAPEKKKDPGFVKFLDGSLAVFNTLTGSDTELVKIYDSEGNLSNYSLVGQTLLVNRNLSEKRTSP